MRFAPTIWVPRSLTPGQGFGSWRGTLANRNDGCGRGRPACGAAQASRSAVAHRRGRYCPADERPPAPPRAAARAGGCRPVAGRLRQGIARGRERHPTDRSGGQAGGGERGDAQHDPAWRLERRRRRRRGGAGGLPRPDQREPAAGRGARQRTRLERGAGRVRAGRRARRRADPLQRRRLASRSDERSDRSAAPDWDAPRSAASR